MLNVSSHTTQMFTFLNLSRVREHHNLCNIDTLIRTIMCHKSNI